MRTSILSYSRKGNVLEDPTKLSRNFRNSGLKHSMDAYSPQKPTHKRQNQTSLPTPSPLSENDPMMSSSYLSSPLETILESLDDYDSQYIPLHDIIEAYSVFSLRIRSQSQAILCAKNPLPALALFEDYAASIARALKRDIRRVLADPWHQHQAPVSFYGSHTTELSITEHDIQHAQSLATLSHISLRVLSDVFTFENLYSYFSVCDLRDLLGDLLKIALTATLPTPNAERTWSLAFWAIQAQNLPRTILSGKKTEIVTALKQALSGERGFQAKLDGLKAVHTLLQRQPELLGPTASSFLPSILSNLVADDVECRRQAANALCGVTLAKLKILSSDFPHETISKDIHTFLKAHTSVSDHSQAALCLPHIISRAFASPIRGEPFWAAMVPACMIVLSDHFLFLRHSLKFCVNSLRPALRHKNKDVRALHSPIWRSLIWAFSRLPVDPTWLPPEDPTIPHTAIGLRGKAFRLLKQDVGSGKGVSLVEALLSHTDKETTSLGSVSRALLVTKSMVADADQADRRDGILLLHRLVSGVGSPTTPSDTPQESADRIILEISKLFDGTLLDAAPEVVGEAVRGLAHVDVNHVRRLSEEEILQHWGQLVDIWIDALEISLREPILSLSREFLDIWQVLLLVKTDLTQGSGHLISSSSFAGQVAAIVSRFLVDSTSPASVQARRLMIVKKLWGVMKNVYSHSWLPAESILAAVLKHEFRLDDDVVRSAWSELCADLISIGIPTLLHVLFTRSEKQEGQEVTRQLWTVLAKTWQDPSCKTGWDELTSFLVIPFKAWVMSDAELELWTYTLQSAVSSAHANSIQTIAVVDRIIQRMGPKELEALASFPKGLCAFLAHFDSAGSFDIPSSLLDIVNRALVSNYPPSPELLAPCLEILHFIGPLLSSAPAALLPQLLSALQGSICGWIGDEKSVMLSTEHEMIVKNLYCRTLDLLRNLPPTIATLNAVAPFLCSAFGRQTQSAIGPAAFDEYWRATYHGIKEYRPLYPDCLKACLLGYSDAYGGSIANGLSMSSGSQDTRKSTIPDSQPSRLARGNTNILQGLASLSLLPEHHALSKSIPSDTEVPGHQRSPSSQDTAQQPRGHPDLKVDVTPLLVSSPQALKLDNQRVSSPSLHKRSSPTPIDKIDQKRRKIVSDLNTVQVFTAGVTPERSPRIPDIDGLQLPTWPSSLPVSQSTDGRKRKRVIDWLDMSGNAAELRTQAVDAASPRTPRGLEAWASSPSEEDYKSWEKGIALEDSEDSLPIKELLGFERVLVPDSDDDDLQGKRNTEVKDGRNIFSSPSHKIRHDLLHQEQQLQQQRYRAQTEPISPPHHEYDWHNENAHTKLTRVGVLERAYTVLTDHASQIPVVDLIQATGIVNKIQSAISEQIARRLASEVVDRS